MASKLLSSAILAFAGIVSLPGQNLSTSLHQAGVHETPVGTLVGQLEQNALTALLGMVVLMAIAWIFCVWNACAGLGKKQKNARLSSLFLCLSVAAGLSVSGSSCTAVQQAHAADIQAEMAAEGAVCVCHAPLGNNQHFGYAGMYNQPNRKPGNGMMVCRQCGRRTPERNR
ncbi:MAG: hypothetical protein JNJ90_19150 [Saprospiraceae bacterium]|jgi:hypothetical protein|nr:hypothetical protein [Saprospiraceae bacterium]